MRQLFFGFLCAIGANAFGQTITTVAGNGTQGYSGDGGPATSAQLSGPTGVAVDAAGNLYIAEENNNCVRKVDGGSGVITTYAGQCGAAGGYGGDGLPATQANLNRPFNLALDPPGNLYIADASNHVVRKVDPAGNISTIAGDGSQCPQHNTCGDGGPAVSAQLDYPRGIAVDAAGNVYIGDPGDVCIRKVSVSGVITTIAGDPGHSISANGNGNEGDGAQAQWSHLSGVHGLALDAAGNLYIADFDDHAIRKITACGGKLDGTCLISRVAGNYTTMGFSGDGGPALNAKFTWPSGIAINTTSGNIYVSDKDNRRVRVIDSAGIINTFAGTGISGYTGNNGPATSAQLADTWQIAVDGCGNIYIADAGASVVRKVASTSNCAKGMTWSLQAVNVPTGTVRVGCSGPCNPHTGDTLCTTALPLLCIRKSGTGFPLPRPASVNNSNMYNRWSGGIIGTTAAIVPPSTLAAASAMCATEFGANWRVAEFHDGWGFAFQAYGGVGNPSQRFWVDINDQPATCWTH